MRSGRAILSLRYTPVSVAGGVRRAVGGFLRYVQHRDQHLDALAGDGLDAYVRYVSHRDRTSSGGRVFGRGAELDVDRKQLVEYVSRSIKGVPPRWVKGRDGKLVDQQRAVYTFVISPEEWRGLDLRRIARVALTSLDQDAGGLGPWLAAEHRNTAHHHVHVVLAARREVAPGRFRAVLVTRPRLERMKQAMRSEIERQRGHELAPVRGLVPQRVRRIQTVAHRPTWKPPRRSRSFVPVHAASKLIAPRHRVGFRSGRPLISWTALGSYFKREMERDVERELRSREYEGWVR
jgi:hypothetical protein